MLCGVAARSLSLLFLTSRVWQHFLSCVALRRRQFMALLAPLIALNCNRLSDTYLHTHTPILIMSKNSKKINNNLLRLRAVATPPMSLINLCDCNFCHRQRFRFVRARFDSIAFRRRLTVCHSLRFPPSPINTG